MVRSRSAAGSPIPVPMPPPGTPWLAGAVIGLTILTMASGAMALGAGLAITRPPK